MERYFLGWRSLALLAPLGATGEEDKEEAAAAARGAGFKRAAISATLPTGWGRGEAKAGNDKKEVGQLAGH